MDFLGSIMGSMDAAKPKQAPMSEKDKLKKKQQKEMYAKLEEKQRQAKIKFRTRIETQINEFLKKENERTIKFEPMDKYHRSVIHDVSEVAGLVGHSFGEEDVDRHIQASRTRIMHAQNLALSDINLNILRYSQFLPPSNFLLAFRCGRRSSALATTNWPH